MVSLASLWLPIVVATVGVFFASSLVHMVLKWHNGDYFQLANEDAVRTAVGKPAPGQYVIPYCRDMKQMQDPAMQQKFVDGPVAFLMVRASGKPTMSAHLGQWFGLCAVTSVLVADIATASNPGTVTTVTATAAFLAYGAGSVSGAIWMGRSWKSAGKDLLDAALYAAVTAASFTLLWPHA